MGHLSEWEVNGASKCIIVFQLGWGEASNVLRRLRTTCSKGVCMRSCYIDEEDLIDKYKLQVPVPTRSEK